MRMKRDRAVRFALVAMLCAAAAGCATPRPAMTLFPEGAAGDEAQVWPGPPEVPRYRYAGQLLGESNFPQSSRSVSASGRLLRWIFGVQTRIEPSRTLARPQGGVVDADGRIMVTDVGRQAVFVFDPVQGLGIWERADQGENFASPLGIALGAAGEVLVADAELARVVRLDAQGNPVGSYGAGVLRRPTGLARDPVTRRTFVADTGAHDIKVFDDSGRLIDTLGARGVAAGRFNAPTFVALSGDSLLVSDTLNARIQRLSLAGESLAILGERGLYVGNLTRPKGVAVDQEGNVYIAESYYDYLLIFDRSGRLLLPIGGAGRAPGKFFLPGGVWSDNASRIFVADVFNGRVVIFQYLDD